MHNTLNKKVTRFTVLVIASVLFAASSFAVPHAYAENVIRTGDTVAITSDQVVSADFYSAASTIIVSGNVTGDALLLGGRISLNGAVDQDLLSAGASVDVHGAVGDDVRVVGNDVTIASTVAGDVVVVARSLTVLSTATIGGDIIFFGGEADIAGSVEGKVMGRAESFRIDGSIAGEIDVTTNQLTLGDRASIEGSVRYVSSGELLRAQGATVTGDVVRNDPATVVSEGSVRSLLVVFLMVLFTLLAGYLLFRRGMESVVRQAEKSALRSVVIGFLVLFGMPLVSGVLFVSMLGIPLGIILLFTYILLLLISLMGTAMIAGTLVQTHLFRSPQFSLHSLLIGTVTVFLLVLVPIVGPLVFTALFLLTLGASAERLYHALRAL